MRHNPATLAPKKEVILRNLSQEKRDVLSLEEVRSYINKIEGFHSQRFKRLALDDLMDLTDEQIHAPIKEDLAKAISPFSKIINQHPWVAEGLIEKQELVQEPQKTFQDVQESTLRRRCSTAKSN